jgi:hypothetical protein
MTVLTPAAVILLFIAVLTAALAVPIVILSFKTYRQAGKKLTEEQQDGIADRSQLLLLIAVIVLCIKLPAWPLFYVALHSLIPSVQGAMCIFGVTATNPFLSSILQTLKPLVFFLIGAWMLLHQFNRGRETAALFRAKQLVLFFTGTVIFLDSALDVLFFTTLETGAEVACCTTVFDLAEGKNAALTASLIGSGWERALGPLFFTTNGLLAVFLGSLHQRMREGRITASVTTGTGALLALLSAVVSLAAFFTIIAPKALDLPGHHCIYCMWQDAPLSLLMTGAFIIGACCAGWLHALNMAQNRFNAGGTAPDLMRNLACLGIGGIATSAAIAAWYLVR